MEALLDVIGAPLSPADRMDLDRCLAAVRAQLDQTAFAAAWKEGQALAADASPAASDKLRDILCFPPLHGFMGFAHRSPDRAKSNSAS